MVPHRAREIQQVALKHRDTTFYTAFEDFDDTEYLIMLAAETVNVEGPAVCILAAGTPNSKVVAYANEAANKLGFQAGTLVSDFCEALGGKGGGQPHLGQGSAAYSDRMLELLNDITQVV